MSCYRMSELNRLLTPGSWLNAIQSQALITHLISEFPDKIIINHTISKMIINNGPNSISDLGNEETGL